LFAVGTLVVTPLLAVLGWIVLNGRDIAATDTSDLLPETAAVSHEDNAYRRLSRAVAQLRDPRVSLSLDEWDDALIGDLLSRNGEVLTSLEDAIACPAYHADEESPPDPWLRLSLFIAQKAAFERRVGVNDLACESSCVLLRLGTWITSGPRSLDEWVQGAMALRLGLAGIERLLRDARPTEPELVALLNRLNQVGATDRGLVQACKMEFQSVKEMIDTYPSARSGPALLAFYKFQPNRTKDAFARFYRRVIQNVPRLPAEVRLPHMASLQLDGTHHYLLMLRPNRQGYVMTKAVLLRQASPGTCFEHKRRIQSDLDGLRLVVACRIYEVRHGQLPETLDALVPELLRDVPRDPFDGKPFRFVRERALVYSVGEDLTDSLGSSRFPVPLPVVREPPEPSDGSDWPEYPSPKPLLLQIRSGTGDLVYPIRPEGEARKVK